MAQSEEVYRALCIGGTLLGTLVTKRKATTTRQVLQLVGIPCRHVLHAVIATENLTAPKKKALFWVDDFG